MHCATKAKEPAWDTGRVLGILEMKQSSLLRLTSSLFRVTCHLGGGEGERPGVSRTRRQGWSEVCG